MADSGEKRFVVRRNAHYRGAEPGEFIAGSKQLVVALDWPNCEAEELEVIVRPRKSKRERKVEAVVNTLVDLGLGLTVDIRGLSNLVVSELEAVDAEDP